MLFLSLCRIPRAETETRARILYIRSSCIFQKRVDGARRRNAADHSNRPDGREVSHRDSLPPGPGRSLYAKLYFSSCLYLYIFRPAAPPLYHFVRTPSCPAVCGDRSAAPRVVRPTPSASLARVRTELDDEATI